MNDYLRWSHLVAAVIVLSGALLLSASFLYSKKVGSLKYVAYLLFFIAALFLGFSKSTYLPFLGETVMPCSVLKEQTPEGANFEVRVSVQGPGRKVLFWAAESETEHLRELVDWRKAYLGFHNAGVAIVNDDNQVILRVRKPQPYTVPTKGRLEAHIHYRVCGENGMLGPVQTHFLGEQESFDVNQKDVKEEFYPVADIDERLYASAV